MNALPFALIFYCPKHDIKRLIFLCFKTEKKLFYDMKWFNDNNLKIVDELRKDCERLSTRQFNLQ